MDDFNKSFNRTRNAIIAFIVVVLVCIIASWILIGVYAVKSADQIQQHGLKSIVESVWCGKDNISCLGK